MPLNAQLSTGQLGAPPTPLSTEGWEDTLNKPRPVCQMFLTAVLPCIRRGTENKTLLHPSRQRQESSWGADATQALPAQGNAQPQSHSHSLAQF